MPVIVDGNNLLYAARQAEASALQLGRGALCDVLRRWAKRRRTRVHIVFDGPAPRGALAGQSGPSDFSVSYSGAGRTADAVLVGMIEADSAARRLLVVSTDRQIARAAKRRRAQAVRSQDFWVRVRQDLARPEPRRPPEPEEKRRGLNPGAADEWLRAFGFK